MATATSKLVRMAARPDKDPDTTTYRGRMAAAVKLRREKLKLSRQELVDKLAAAGSGITIDALYKYERGLRPIQIDDLPAFAKALDCPIHKLIPTE